MDAANNLKQKIYKAGGRVEVFEDSEPMRVKIAKAQSQKIPYMIILGDKEIESGDLSIRERQKGDIGKMKEEDFLQLIIDAKV